MSASRPYQGTPQVVLREYPSIARTMKDSKESAFRFRLVKRRSPFGDIASYIDIREYVIDEHKAMFTRMGISLPVSDINKIIENLQAMKRDIEANTHGTDPRN